MADLTVVGVGPGGKQYLTLAATQAVKQATVLVGGRRQLTLFDDCNAEKYVIDANLTNVIDIIKNKVNNGEKVVVLASGDPGFYGILSTIKKHLKQITIDVEPGISSIQLACAKLALTWHDGFLTSCHGRSEGDLIKAVQQNRKVIALTDANKNPVYIAQKLQLLKVLDRPVAVACNLSYPDELIMETTLYQLAAVKHWVHNNCVMVINSV